MMPDAIHVPIKTARALIQSNDLVVYEDLKVKNMVKNHHVAKSIHDASWNNFIKMLSYKAVTSGGELIKVNPKGTSKTCNQCGNNQDMPLSKREYKCSCGYEGNRDINASINILSRAGLARTHTPVDIIPLLQSNEASVVNEAGTILHGS